MGKSLSITSWTIVCGLIGHALYDPYGLPVTVAAALAALGATFAYGLELILFDAD